MCLWEFHIQEGAFTTKLTILAATILLSSRKLLARISVPLGTDMLFATSYFGNRILRHVKADVRRLREEGFDIVVHTFSENDLRFYPKSMKDIVEATRAAEMRVWIDPWGVGGVFGGEAFSDVALRHPDWLQIAANGDRIPACCPSNPHFRSFMHEWTDAAVGSGADAVFWDEPHFYSDGNDGSGCYCEHCRKLGKPGGSAIALFLGEVCSRVNRRGGHNVVCMRTPSPAGKNTIDWNEIAALDGVTNLGSTPFWGICDEDPEKYVERVSQDLLAVASRAAIQTHLWIQGFRISAGREEEISKATLAAGKLGVNVIAIWGIDACESMSSLSSERPQVAWAAFLKAMRELRG